MSGSLGKIPPQGAPRGVLIYWILHRIAARPTHGYEILVEIDTKSDGAWRPGPGSVYPILSKLRRAGLIEADGTAGKADQQKYKITRKGLAQIEESKETFRMMMRRLGHLRGLFIDLIGPDEIAGFLVEGAKKQFDLARGILASNRSRISDKELNYILREYSLLLERQQEWASSLMSELVQRQHVPALTAKKRSQK
jgi:DNA-binding PadR family transcriptional regulator